MEDHLNDVGVNISFAKTVLELGDMSQEPKEVSSSQHVMERGMMGQER